ncbi:MAG TPA: hypothetical protein VGM28_00120 [Candidatus Limnocylindrales bacterium]|jgi:hypothetical protein
MDTSGDPTNAAVVRTLDQELTLLRQAIALVAGGGSPRVVVSGLHFGETLLESGRSLAAAAGVRLVPLWMPDDAGADIAVERIGDA